MAEVARKTAGRNPSRAQELVDRIKELLVERALIPSELVKRLNEVGFSKTTVLRTLEKLAREGEICFAPAESGTISRSNPTGHYSLSGTQRAEVLGNLTHRPVAAQLAAGSAIVFAQCRSVQVSDLLRVTAVPAVIRHVAWVCRVDGELNGFFFGIDQAAASSDSDRLVKVLADVGISATTSIVRESVSASGLIAQAHRVLGGEAKQAEDATMPVDLESRRPRLAERSASSPHAE